LKKKQEKKLVNGKKLVSEVESDGLGDLLV